MKHKLIYSITAIGFAALLGCVTTSTTVNPNAAFKYREVFLPERDSKEYKALGLNKIEDDWGLWGHNLKNVLPEKPSQSVYARHGDEIYKEQFCFTSPRLFEYIEEYIVDNYGEDDSKRFAILPNDNSIVCLCEECVALGNTRNDASPAVNALIEKLAYRFPGHYFFTSDYSTTKSVPEEPFPENTGVLISAIEFPLASGNTAEELKFEDKLFKWSNKTENVYIWDYINNFDDYLTPYPVFGPMQRRFQLYKGAKVGGVFLNGSGTDFSTFSRLKTHVLAALMEDPDIDWRSLLTEKSIEFYPVTGTAISDFLLNQEDFIAENNSQLPLYEGIVKETKTYLPADSFISFHNRLTELSRNASAEEQKEVGKMIKAMALTRLELMRQRGDLTGYEQFIDMLRSFEKEEGEPIYSESGWDLLTYMKDYEFMARKAAETKDNKLKGLKLIPMSGMDPEYSDVTVMTDGLIGIPSNYHDGLVLNTPEKKWSLAVPPTPGLNKIRVWTASNPVFRIQQPKTVSLYVGDHPVSKGEPVVLKDNPSHAYVDLNVPKTLTGTLLITLEVDPDARGSIAIEEIQGF